MDILQWPVVHLRGGVIPQVTSMWVSCIFSCKVHCIEYALHPEWTSNILCLILRIEKPSVCYVVLFDLIVALELFFTFVVV